MAIQEIEVSSAQGTKGFAKKIDSGAKRMVFDILQATQYQKPEESTVRELASNAVDSQREKNIAIDILRDKASPSKYFIERDGEKYKDSNWDPTYYDLNHLDMENNHVEIQYTENEGVGFCDTLTIKDFGVGIGDSRIEGVISLGYSTKRNNKAVLGAWGLGAKVALSMRSDYYKIETVHNGRKFIFNCYAYKTDFAIGKFNLNTGENNEYITLSDGTEVYYENTDEKNYTKVTVFCKRHHRSNIKNAVRSQLLYFNNVTFDYRYENEEASESVDFLADVIYNSDNIIISNNHQFSKPHVVIVKGDDSFDTTGVCYGYIDFTQLEMENLKGNIGIKCPIRSTVRDEITGEETVLIDGVSVTPSRESVIWDDHTREFLLKKLQDVVNEASILVAKELVEDDFIEWLEKCRTVISNVDRSSVIGRMSMLIDKSKLKPAFQPEPLLKYTNVNELFWSYNIRRVSSHFDRSKKKTIVTRDDVEFWHDLNTERLFYKKGPTSKYKDEYIIQTMGQFTMIEMGEIPKEFNVKDLSDDANDSDIAKMKKHYVKRRDLVYEYLVKSKLYKDYDTLEVPEDWQKKIDDRDEEEGKLAEHEELTPAELRKLENKIPVKYIVRYWKNTQWSKDDYDSRFHHWKMTDIKIPELQQSEDIIYYGHNADDKKLCFAAHFVVRGKNQYEFENWDTFKPNTGSENPYKFLKISNINKKYLNEFLHIDRFFKIMINDTITMDNKLVNWHTARLISDQLKNLRMFRNFEAFNSDLSEKYEKLVKFYDQHQHAFGWYSYSTTEMKDEIMEYFDKVLNFQLFVKDNPNDPEAIAERSMQLFSIDDAKNAIAVDIEMYDILQELLEYAEEVGPLLNNVEFLFQTKDISNEQEVLVKDILLSKRLEIS